MDWWSNWTAYVNFVNQADIVSKKTKQLSLDSSDSGNSGNVVATSYTQLDSMTENQGLRPPSSSDEVCKLTNFFSSQNFEALHQRFCLLATCGGAALGANTTNNLMLFTQSQLFWGNVQLHFRMYVLLSVA